MLTRKISAYWTAVSGVVTFAVGIFATLQGVSIAERNHQEAQKSQASELSDRERDFVLKIVEMQNTDDPQKAQAIFRMTQVVARHYLTDQAFADSFINSIAGQSLAISGAATQAAADATVEHGQTPDAVGAAAAIGQVKTAAELQQTSTVSAAATPAAVTAVLQARTARVFFQYARPEQLEVSQAVRGQLQQVLGSGWTVSGDQRVPSFAGTVQVRYFYPADRDQATGLARALRTAFPNANCQRNKGYDVAGRVKPQLFEVWIGPRDAPVGAVRAAAPSKTALCSA